MDTQLKSCLTDVSAVNRERRTIRRIEHISIEDRETIERAYASDPERTHADLVYSGYWIIAAQLKIDRQVGRI